MENSSLAELKLSLEASCEFLQLFSLGRPGFTQQDVAAGIQRVIDQRDRLNKLVTVGPSAAEAKTIDASAGASVLAAEARLARLRKKSG